MTESVAEFDRRIRDKVDHYKATTPLSQQLADYMKSLMGVITLEVAHRGASQWRKDQATLDDPASLMCFWFLIATGDLIVIRDTPQSLYVRTKENAR